MCCANVFIDIYDRRYINYILSLDTTIVPLLVATLNRCQPLNMTIDICSSCQCTYLSLSPKATSLILLEMDYCSSSINSHTAFNITAKIILSRYFTGILTIPQGPYPSQCPHCPQLLSSPDVPSSVSAAVEPAQTLEAQNSVAEITKHRNITPSHLS